MRRSAIVLACLSTLVLASPPAAADTGVYAGGGLRWAGAGNEVAFGLHGSFDIAPLLVLGADLYGACDGGDALVFSGAGLSLLLSPPIPGAFSLELGLAAGIVDLTVERHGRDGLPAYLAAEAAAGAGFGPVGLRLSFQTVLTSGHASLGLESQLLLMIGARF